MKKELIEGKKYHNNFNNRWFTVISIDKPNLIFQYDGGDIQTGEYEAKRKLVEASIETSSENVFNFYVLPQVLSRIDRAGEIDDEIDNLSEEDADFFHRQLGHFASKGNKKANSTLILNSGEPGQMAFEELFEYFTGEKAVGYSFHSNEDQFSYQLKIVFNSDKWSNNFFFLLDHHLEKSKKGTVDSLKRNKPGEVYESYYRKEPYEVSSVDYIWLLIRYGFVLGKEQDIEKIRLNIPVKYQKAFDEGFKSPTFAEIF